MLVDNNNRLDYSIPLDTFNSINNSSVPQEDAIPETVAETKSRCDCDAGTVGRGLVITGMPPQGALGGLLVYQLFMLMTAANDREKVPYIFLVSLGLLLALVFCLVLIRARVGLLAPFVSFQTKKLAAALSCQTRPALTHSGSRSMTPRNNFRQRCLNLLYNVLIKLINILGSFNISLVFAGLGLIACEISADAVRAVDNNLLNEIADILDSTPVKAFFVANALGINVLCFYSTHQFFANQLSSIAHSCWYRVSEDPMLYAKRQHVIRLVKNLRQQVIVENNRLIHNSNSPRITLIPHLTETISELKEKNIRGPSLDSLMQTLVTTSQTYYIPTPFFSKIMQYTTAGLACTVGVLGLWNFFYLQGQALEFLLAEIGQLDTETAIDITDRYTAWGGAHCMAATMTLFFIYGIGSGVLSLFNRHEQPDVNQALPGPGTIGYWFLRVFTIALMSTSPNASATLSALDDASIQYDSPTGKFILATSVLGPLVMEIFGMDRDYREQALKKILKDKGQEFKIALAQPQLIDECRFLIEQLPSADMQQLVALAPHGTFDSVRPTGSSWPRFKFRDRTGTKETEMSQLESQSAYNYQAFNKRSL